MKDQIRETIALSAVLGAAIDRERHLKHASVQTCIIVRYEVDTVSDGVACAADDPSVDEDRR